MNIIKHLYWKWRNNKHRLCRDVYDFLFVILFVVIVVFFIIIFNYEPESFFYKKHITCYSGNQIIYEGDSRYISFGTNYTWWYDIKTKNRIKSTADCIVQ